MDKIRGVKHCVMVLGLLSIVGTSGCTSINAYTGDKEISDTAIGGGVGATIGALGGAIIGGNEGALIGAGLGGFGGTLIGHSLDHENTELQKQLVGSGVQIKKLNNSIQLIMASDVTFATNSADIDSNFYSTLNSLAIILKKYNKTNIVVSGFTDNTGADMYNQILSEHRAASITKYLESQYIEAVRLNYRGFGKRNPIASNSTPAGRAQNRRVEITLKPINQ